MKRSALLLLSATAFLAACSHKSETTTDINTNVTANETDMAVANDTAPAPVVSEGQGFANGAGSSDAFEIASSKLAATNAGSAAVKKFATQMIAAHSESTADLTAIAAKLTPPITSDTTLTSEQSAKLTALNAKQGAAFDAAYAEEQVAAHEKALTMLKAYAATGGVPEFKTFAAALSPKVAAHLNMAKSLKP
jgi:putative membrane protein